MINVSEAKSVNSLEALNKSIFFLFTVKDDDCVKYLIRADRMGQKVTKALAIYLVLWTLCVCLAYVIYTLADFYWKNGYIDAEQLTLPYIK